MRRKASAHRRGLAVAAAATFVASTVMATWFEAGHFFATGDVGPFLRTGLSSEVGSAWSHATSGAGSRGYTVVRVPELIAIRVARALGGGEPLAERLLYAAMFGWAATGGALLLRRFTHRAPVIAVGGVLAAFNLLTLSGLPNYLPVVVIGVVGTLTAIAVDIAHGERRRRTLAVVAASLPMAYVALNPPLTAVVTGWVLLLPIAAATLTGTGAAGARRVVRAMALWAPWVVSAHLWWIVPQVGAITAARDAGAIGAQTDVVAWAWTHANNSLANVMTMRNAWTWPVDAYHGLAATALGRPGVAWLTWLMPLSLALAPLLARRRRPRVDALVLGCVLCWLVGKGLHGPAAFVNRWFYELVPGAWLLREPMGKIGMLPMLGMLIAWTIVIEELTSVVRSTATISRRRVAAGLAALLIAGPLVLTWPMATGVVTRDELAGRTEQVEVPAGWFDLAAAVDGSERTGKLLVLPTVDFYQMPTTWGFYGTDTLVRGLVARPTLLRNPQGYVTDLPIVDDLVRSVEDALVASDGTAVAVLRALGVDQVLVRRDFDTSSPIRSIDVVQPERLIAALEATDGMSVRLANPLGTLFEFDEPVPQARIARGVLDFGDWDDARRLRSALADVPDGYALADGPDAPAGRVWTLSPDAPDALVLDQPATVSVTRRGVPRSAYRVEPHDTGPGVRIVEADPPNLGPITLAPRVAADVALKREPVALEVDGRVVRLDPVARTDELELRASDVVRPLHTSAADGLGALGPLGNCHRHDDRDRAALGHASRSSRRDGRVDVRLQARAHRSCRSATLIDGEAGAIVRLTVDARTLAGSAPSLCLWLRGPDRCADLPPATSVGGGWERTDAIVTIPDGVTRTDLFVYADAPIGNQTRTVTEYRMRASSLVAGPPFPLAIADAAAQDVDLPAGAHRASTAVGAGPSIGGWSVVGDCHRTDERSYADLGLAATPIGDDGVRLDAEAHVACVHGSVRGLDPGREHVLRVTHRTVRGAGPRLCLFEPIERRCLEPSGDAGPGGRLDATSQRTTSRVRFVPPVERLELYVYADSTAGGTTVEYDDPAVTPGDDEILTVVQLEDESTAPAAAVASIVDTGPHPEVLVTGGGRMLLSTTEAFDEGWVLEGVGADATVDHVVIDGYRNGWLLDTPTPARLRVTYGPDRTHQLVRWASLATMVVLVIGTAARSLLRRHPIAGRGLARATTRPRVLRGARAG
ncbi:MAG: hypothetical protein S0880_14975 [Actinomycetota bacterium]|nr:hypothetical protein [Actinomycetota bacterium]